MELQSLGVIGSAARGIVASGSSNTTPIVLTVNAGHGLTVGQWIVVSGVTGNTGANGEWELSAVSATTVTLMGSVGNGTHAGTPVIAVMMKNTPFLAKRRAVASILDGGTPVVGTMLVEKSSDNVTFVDAKIGVPLPANPGNILIEVELDRFMVFRASAFTSGGARCDLINGY